MDAQTPRLERGGAERRPLLRVDRAARDTCIRGDVNTMALSLASSPVDRIPPQNLEAEMAVLGSILVDREIMATVSELVAASDFYAHVHEAIFAALTALYERGEPLDKITLVEELRRRGQLEKVGGAAYISRLMETVPTAASAEYYARIVREKSTLRSLIHAGTQITQLGFDQEDDVDGALDQSEQLVYAIGKRQLRGEFTPVTKLLKSTFETIDRLYHSRGDRTGLTSGFRDIDQYTAGFQPGNFIILAARPAMGKTSLALNMAAAAAKEEGRPVAIFSLEMTNEELVQRLLCAEARIDAQALRKGNIAPTDWEKISYGMGVLSETPLYIDDSGTVTVTEVRSRIRRLQSAEGGLAAVFIDYLQLLRPGTIFKSANRNDELTDICRTLKATAKDLAVPIIALAQLNRGVESRNDKRPLLSDLRDCLAGNALVANADNGMRVPVREIVARNLRFDVWAIDERLQLVRRPITDAWRVGERPVFRVTTQSGRTIRCTGGHRFLTVAGWRELRELHVGSTIGVPRRYGAPSAPRGDISPGRALLLGWLVGDGHLGGSPALTVATTREAALAIDLGRTEFGLRPFAKPERRDTPAQRVILTTGRLCGAGKNPLTRWLRDLGIWRKTGAEKRVPPLVHAQPDDVVAAFLRGLFHADGSLTRSTGRTRVAVRLTTISETLARDVQHLLLRFGINAAVTCDTRKIGGYRTEMTTLWTVSLFQRGAVCTFIDRIGFLGEKQTRAAANVERTKRNDASHVDRLPLEINARVSARRRELGLSHASLGWREQGKAMSRATSAVLASRLDDDLLERLAFSDVLWERIAAIEPAGVEEVFDITVGDVHNFCVDDFVTHNSGAIEQEADMVAFLYREAYYNPESAPEPDLTEFIIAKQRNGPTGTVRMRFLKEHTLFVPYGDASHYAGP